MTAADVVVVGGGLVGAAVAYGIARSGQCVDLLDEGDVAYRASRGNFGLVWVQGKGDGRPEYAIWSRRSADLWPGFSESLFDETGIPLHYHKPGGVHLCLSEAALEARKDVIRRMHNVHGAADYGARIVDRKELDAMLPGLGPDVVGGSWSPHDGHANPLHLLRALHAGLLRLGGRYHANAAAQAIARDGSGFTVETRAGSYSGGKVVLAAGLGNRPLGGMVGLEVPVSPLKGQILVTERSTERLRMPTTFVRQTNEGSYLLGDSHEDAGFDTTARPAIMADIALRAIRSFPFLGTLRVVRSWAALRIMSADGFPIYQQSLTHPGAFSVNCHSGVTLAAAHALKLAPMIAAGALEGEAATFSAERFHVQTH